MTAPVRKPINAGTVQTCYVSATPFAETVDAEAEFLSALGTANQFERIDNILEGGKLIDNRQTADVKPRGLDFVSVLVGGRVLGFTASIFKSLGATGYELLLTAYRANSVIGVAIGTGPVGTVGSKFVCFNAQILKFDEDQPDPGAAMHDFEVRVTAESIVVPTVATIAS